MKKTDKDYQCKGSSDPDHLCREWLGTSGTDQQTWNNLLRNKIRTRQQLQKLTRDEYLTWRNCGPGTWDYIESMQHWSRQLPCN